MLEPKSLQESILKHQLALLNSNSSTQTQLTNEMSSSFIPNMLNSTISNESLNNLYAYNQQQQHHHFSKLGYNSFSIHSDNILTEKMNKKRKLDERENYRNEMTQANNFETSETNKRKKNSFLISDILDLENGHNSKSFCLRNAKEEDVEDKVSNCAPQNEKTYVDKLSMDQFQAQLHRYVSTLPIDFYRLFMSLVNQTINSQSLTNNPMLDFSLKMQNKLGPLIHSNHNSSNQGGCSNKSHKYEDISLCSSSTSSSSSLMHDEEGKFLQHEISSNKKSNSNITQSTPSTQSILSSLELLAKNQFTDNFASSGTYSTKNGGASSDDQSGNRSSKKQSKFSPETENKQNFNSVRKQSSENTKNESNSNSRSSSNSALPAWIFCTRYSDRPSAGKSLIFCKIIIEIRDQIILNLLCNYMPIICYSFMKKKITN